MGTREVLLDRLNVLKDCLIPGFPGPLWATVLKNFVAVMDAYIATLPSEKDK
jgi:hypothetical protein